MNEKNTPHRFVSRDGNVNIQKHGLSRRQPVDWYHVLINLDLVRLLLILGFYFFAINALFAFLFWLDKDGLLVERSCSFGDLFFFSVHVFSTLGFDQVLAHSFYTNVLVALDSFAGWCSFGLITGLLFSRFSRPSARIIFTERALITSFDGVPTFSFRTANRLGNQILQAQATVTLSRNERTLEGEDIRRVYDLKLMRATNSLFNLTWTLRHVIDESSPLFKQTPKSLRENETEIVVLLSGIDESFGQAVYSRFAYNHEEIVFGARYANLFERDEENRPIIDFSKFDKVEQTQIVDK